MSRSGRASLKRRRAGTWRSAGSRRRGGSSWRRGAGGGSATWRRGAPTAHLGEGVDRWATRALLASNELAPDAAGALRAVLSGDVVTQTVAAKWGKPRLCPHCGLLDEDREHRFWCCPCWDEPRREALQGLSSRWVRGCLPTGTTLGGVLPLDPRLAALALVAKLEVPAPLDPVEAAAVR